jgi:4-hydroxy-tetrahydrodipicolinate reductase
MLKIAVHGASGRAGSLVVRAVPQHPRCVLVGAFVAPNSPALGTMALSAEANHQIPVMYSACNDEDLAQAKVVIDFSTPQASVELVQRCARLGITVLVCTTGFSNEQREAIRAAATGCAILEASNTSLGIFALRQACARVQHILGPEFEIEIVELHHRHKRDAPSGTARTIATDLAQDGVLEPTFDRSRVHRARGLNEIGVQSLRGGDASGEHTVYFLGNGERIEVSHRVSDRSVFAHGAIRLAQKLVGKTPGVYQTAELF